MFAIRVIFVEISQRWSSYIFKFEIRDIKLILQFWESAQRLSPSFLSFGVLWQPLATSSVILNLGVVKLPSFLKSYWSVYSLELAKNGGKPWMYIYGMRERKDKSARWLIKRGTYFMHFQGSFLAFICAGETVSGGWATFCRVLFWWGEA